MDDVLNYIGLIQKAGKAVTGEEGILKTIRSKDAFLVITAKDASENTKKKYRDKCQFYNVKYVEYGTIADISKMLNRNNRVAIAVCDDGFSRGLLAKILK